MSKYLVSAALPLICLLLMECKQNKSTDKNIVTESTEKFGSLYVINQEQSIIYWLGSSIKGAHNGTIKIKDGQLEIDSYGQLKSGNVHIDMKSITNIDLSGEDKKDLENHLSGPDFFAVDTFPEADFIITKVDALSDSLTNNLITGNLSLKGNTHEIKIKAKIILSGNTAFITIPEFTVDRTKWNINYQSSKIIDAVKDKLISDDIKLNMKVMATRK